MPVPLCTCGVHLTRGALSCTFWPPTCSVNGVPSCANEWLLKDVARGEWGFDGYVTSDCDADGLVSAVHHYHNDSAEEAVRDIFRAGTDNDCGGFIGQHAMSALNQSYITMGDVDERLAMLWRVRMRPVEIPPLRNRASAREH